MRAHHWAATNDMVMLRVAAFAAITAQDVLVALLGFRLLSYGLRPPDPDDFGAKLGHSRKA